MKYLMNPMKVVFLFTLYYIANLTSTDEVVYSLTQRYVMDGQVSSAYVEILVGRTYPSELNQYNRILTVKRIKRMLFSSMENSEEMDFFSESIMDLFYFVDGNGMIRPHFGVWLNENFALPALQKSVLETVKLFLVFQNATLYNEVARGISTGVVTIHDLAYFSKDFNSCRAEFRVLGSKSSDQVVTVTKSRLPKDCDVTYHQNGADVTPDEVGSEDGMPVSLPKGTYQVVREYRNGVLVQCASRQKIQVSASVMHTSNEMKIIAPANSNSLFTHDDADAAGPGGRSSGEYVQPARSFFVEMPLEWDVEEFLYNQRRADGRAGGSSHFFTDEDLKSIVESAVWDETDEYWKAKKLASILSDRTGATAGADDLGPQLCGVFCRIFSGSAALESPLKVENNTLITALVIASASGMDFVDDALTHCVIGNDNLSEEARMFGLFSLPVSDAILDNLIDIAHGASASFSKDFRKSFFEELGRQLHYSLETHAKKATTLRASVSSFLDYLLEAVERGSAEERRFSLLAIKNIHSYEPVAESVVRYLLANSWSVDVKDLLFCLDVLKSYLYIPEVEELVFGFMENFQSTSGRISCFTVLLEGNPEKYLDALLSHLEGEPEIVRKTMIFELKRHDMYATNSGYINYSPRRILHPFLVDPLDPGATFAVDWNWNFFKNWENNVGNGQFGVWYQITLNNEIDVKLNEADMHFPLVYVLFHNQLRFGISLFGKFFNILDVGIHIFFDTKTLVKDLTGEYYRRENVDAIQPTSSDIVTQRLEETEGGKDYSNILEPSSTNNNERRQMQMPPVYRFHMEDLSFRYDIMRFHPIGTHGARLVCLAMVIRSYQEFFNDNPILDYIPPVTPKTLNEYLRMNDGYLSPSGQVNVKSIEYFGFHVQEAYGPDAVLDALNNINFDGYYRIMLYYYDGGPLTSYALCREWTSVVFYCFDPRYENAAKYILPEDILSVTVMKPSYNNALYWDRARSRWKMECPEGYYRYANSYYCTMDLESSHYVDREIKHISYDNSYSCPTGQVYTQVEPMTNDLNDCADFGVTTSGFWLHSQCNWVKECYNDCNRLDMDECITYFVEGGTNRCFESDIDNQYDRDTCFGFLDLFAGYLETKGQHAFAIAKKKHCRCQGGEADPYIFTETLTIHSSQDCWLFSSSHLLELSYLPEFFLANMRSFCYMEPKQANFVLQGLFSDYVFTSSEKAELESLKVELADDLAVAYAQVEYSNSDNDITKLNEILAQGYLIDTHYTWMSTNGENIRDVFRRKSAFYFTKIKVLLMESYVAMSEMGVRECEMPPEKVYNLFVSSNMSPIDPTYMKFVMNWFHECAIATHSLSIVQKVMLGVFSPTIQDPFGYHYMELPILQCLAAIFTKNTKECLEGDTEIHIDVRMKKKPMTFDIFSIQAASPLILVKLSVAGIFSVHIEVGMRIVASIKAELGFELYKMQLKGEFLQISLAIQAYTDLSVNLGFVRGGIRGHITLFDKQVSFLGDLMILSQLLNMDVVFRAAFGESEFYAWYQLWVIKLCRAWIFWVPCPSWGSEIRVQIGGTKGMSFESARLTIFKTFSNPPNNPPRGVDGIINIRENSVPVMYHLVAKDDDSASSLLSFVILSEDNVLSSTFDYIQIVYFDPFNGWLWIKPLPHVSGTFYLVYRVIDEDYMSLDEHVGTITINVEPVVQAPFLYVGPSYATVREDTFFDFYIGAALADQDYSEYLSIDITSIPEGATLSIDDVETVVYGGNFRLVDWVPQTIEFYKTIRIKPPPNDFFGNHLGDRWGFNIVIAAWAMESLADNDRFACSTSNVHFDVLPVNDPCSLTVTEPANLQISMFESGSGVVKSFFSDPDIFNFHVTCQVQATKGVLNIDPSFVSFLSSTKNDDFYLRFTCEKTRMNDVLQNGIRYTAVIQEHGYGHHGPDAIHITCCDNGNYGESDHGETESCDIKTVNVDIMQVNEYPQFFDFPSAGSTMVFVDPTTTKQFQFSLVDDSQSLTVSLNSFPGVISQVNFLPLGWSIVSGLGTGNVVLSNVAYTPFQVDVFSVTYATSSDTCLHAIAVTVSDGEFDTEATYALVMEENTRKRRRTTAADGSSKNSAIVDDFFNISPEDLIQTRQSMDQKSRGEFNSRRKIEVEVNTPSYTFSHYEFATHNGIVFLSQDECDNGLIAKGITDLHPHYHCTNVQTWSHACCYPEIRCFDGDTPENDRYPVSKVSVMIWYAGNQMAQSHLDWENYYIPLELSSFTPDPGYFFAGENYCPPGSYTNLYYPDASVKYYLKFEYPDPYQAGLQTIADYTRRVEYSVAPNVSPEMEYIGAFYNNMYETPGYPREYGLVFRDYQYRGPDDFDSYCLSDHYGTIIYTDEFFFSYPCMCFGTPSSLALNCDAFINLINYHCHARKRYQVWVGEICLAEDMIVYEPLTVMPVHMPVDGSVNFEITGNNFIDGLAVFCRFGGTGDVEGTVVEGVVHCPEPTTRGEGLRPVSVFQGYPGGWSPWLPVYFFPNSPSVKSFPYTTTTVIGEECDFEFDCSQLKLEFFNPAIARFDVDIPLDFPDTYVTLVIRAPSKGKFALSPDVLDGDYFTTDQTRVDTASRTWMHINGLYYIPFPDASGLDFIQLELKYFDPQYTECKIYQIPIYIAPKPDVPVISNFPAAINVVENSIFSFNPPVSFSDVDGDYRYDVAGNAFPNLYDLSISVQYGKFRFAFFPDVWYDVNSPFLHGDISLSTLNSYIGNFQYIYDGEERCSDTIEFNVADVFMRYTDFTADPPVPIRTNIFAGNLFSPKELTVLIKRTNDAPVILKDGQATSETISFFGIEIEPVALSGLTVEDVDMFERGLGELHITSNANTGKLIVGDLSNVLVLESSPSVFKVRGSLVGINSFLASLSYSTPKFFFTTPASPIQLGLFFSDLGYTGDEIPKMVRTVSKILEIHVANVDDPPIINAGKMSWNVIEDTVYSDLQISIVDYDFREFVQVDLHCAYCAWAHQSLITQPSVDFDVHLEGTLESVSSDLYSLEYHPLQQHSGWDTVDISASTVSGQANPLSISVFIKPVVDEYIVTIANVTINQSYDEQLVDIVVESAVCVDVDQERKIQIICTYSEFAFDGGYVNKDEFSKTYNYWENEFSLIKLVVPAMVHGTFAFAVKAITWEVLTGEMLVRDSSFVVTVNKGNLPIRYSVPNTHFRKGTEGKELVLDNFPVQLQAFDTSVHATANCHLCVTNLEGEKDGFVKVGMTVFLEDVFFGPVSLSETNELLSVIKVKLGENKFGERLVVVSCDNNGVETQTELPIFFENVFSDFSFVVTSGSEGGGRRRVQSEEDHYLARFKQFETTVFSIDLIDHDKNDDVYCYIYVDGGVLTSPHLITIFPDETAYNASVVEGPVSVAELHEEGFEKLCVLLPLSDLKLLLSDMEYKPYDRTRYEQAITVSVGSSLGGLTPRTMNFYVEPVNIAPVLSVVANVVGKEEELLVFETGLKVLDDEPIGLGVLARLMFSYDSSHGELLLHSFENVNVVDLSEGLVIIEGKREDIELSAAQLSFNPMPNFFGRSNVTVTYSDMELMENGGSKEDTKILGLVFENVYDDPIIKQLQPFVPISLPNPSSIVNIPSGLISINDFDGGVVNHTLEIRVLNGYIWYEGVKERTVTFEDVFLPWIEEALETHLSYECSHLLCDLEEEDTMFIDITNSFGPFEFSADVQFGIIRTGIPVTSYDLDSVVIFDTAPVSIGLTTPQLDDAISGTLNIVKVIVECRQDDTAIFSWAVPLGAPKWEITAPNKQGTLEWFDELEYRNDVIGTEQFVSFKIKYQEKVDVYNVKYVTSYELQAPQTSISVSQITMWENAAYDISSVLSLATNNPGRFPIEKKIIVKNVPSDFLLTTNVANSHCSEEVVCDQMEFDYVEDGFFLKIFPRRYFKGEVEAMELELRVHNPLTSQVLSDAVVFSIDVFPVINNVEIKTRDLAILESVTRFPVELEFEIEDPHEVLDNVWMVSGFGMIEGSVLLADDMYSIPIDILQQPLYFVVTERVFIDNFEVVFYCETSELYNGERISRESSASMVVDVIHDFAQISFSIAEAPLVQIVEDSLVFLHVSYGFESGLDEQLHIDVIGLENILTMNDVQPQNNTQSIFDFVPYEEQGSLTLEIVPAVNSFGSFDIIFEVYSTEVSLGRSDSSMYSVSIFIDQVYDNTVVKIQPEGTEVIISFGNLPASLRSLTLYNPDYVSDHMHTYHVEIVSNGADLELSTTFWNEEDIPPNPLSINATALEVDNFFDFVYFQCVGTNYLYQSISVFVDDYGCCGTRIVEGAPTTISETQITLFCEPDNHQATLHVFDVEVLETTSATAPVYASSTGMWVEDIDKEENEYSIIFECATAKFKLDSFIANNIISINGTRDVVNEELSRLEIGAKELHYNGVDNVIVTFIDFGSSSIGDVTFVSKLNFSVVVIAVNTPPVIESSLTTLYIVRPLYVLLDFVTFYDWDDLNANLQLSLTCSGGKFELDDTIANALSAHSGRSTSSLVIFGTESQLKNALQFVSYWPSISMNGQGEFIHMEINDLGNSGLGGEMISSENIVNAITVHRNLVPQWNDANVERNRIEIFQSTDHSTSSWIYRGLCIVVPDADPDETCRIDISWTVGSITHPPQGWSGFVLSQTANSLSIEGTVDVLNSYISALEFTAPANTHGAFELRLIPSFEQLEWSKQWVGNVRVVPVVIVKCEDMTIKESTDAEQFTEYPRISLSDTGIGSDASHIYRVSLSCSKCGFLYQSVFTKYSLEILNTRDSLNSLFTSELKIGTHENYFVGDDVVYIELQDVDDAAFVIASQFGVSVSVQGQNSAPIVETSQLRLDIVRPLYCSLEIFSFYDLDDNNQILELTISSPDGRLELDSAIADALFSCTGLSTSLVTIQGTEYDLNQALANVVYWPSISMNGQLGTIQVDVDDLGNSGIGGPLIGSNSVDVMVHSLDLTPQWENSNVKRNRIEIFEAASPSVWNYDGIQMIIPDAEEDEIARIELAWTTGSFADPPDAWDGSIVSKTSNSIAVEGTVSQLNSYVSQLSFSPPLGVSGAFELQLTPSCEQPEWSQRWTGDVLVIPIIIIQCQDMSIEESTESLRVTDFPRIVAENVGLGTDASHLYLVSLSCENCGFMFQGEFFESSLEIISRRDSLNNLFSSELQIGGIENFDGVVVVAIELSDQDDPLFVISSQFRVFVTAVNTAPNIMKSLERLDIEYPLYTFLNVFSIFDWDDGNGILEVSISSPDGKLILNSAMSDSLAFHSGNETTQIVLRDTESKLNIAIQNVAYYPSFSMNGQLGTIHLSVDDLGNSGAGGALSSSDSVEVMIHSRDLVPQWNDSNVQRNRIELFESTSIFVSSSIFSGLRLNVPDLTDDEFLQVLLEWTSGGSFSLPDWSGAVIGETESSLEIQGTLSQINAYISELVYTPRLNEYGTFEVGLSPSCNQLEWSKTWEGSVKTIPIIIIQCEDKVLVEETTMMTNGDFLNLKTVPIQIAVDNTGIGGDASNRIVVRITCGKCGIYYEDVFTQYFREVVTTRDSLGSLFSSQLSIGGHEVNFHGSDIVSVLLEDIDNPPFQIRTEFALSVTPVNTPPEITVASSSIVVRKPLFGNVLEGVSIIDHDSGDGNVKTRVECSHGRLEVEGEYPSSAVITGNGGSVIVIEGVDVEATNGIFRNNVVFWPFYMPESFFASVNVSVDDLGNFGSGGNLQSTASLDVLVIPRNLIVSWDDSGLERNYIHIAENSEGILHGLKMECGDLESDELMFIEIRVSGGDIDLPSVIANDRIAIMDYSKDIRPHSLFPDYSESLLVLQGTIDSLNAFIGEIRYVPTEGLFTSNALGHFFLNLSPFTQQPEWDKVWDGVEKFVEIRIDSVFNVPTLRSPFCKEKKPLLVREDEDTHVNLQRSRGNESETFSMAIELDLDFNLGDVFVDGEIVLAGQKRVVENVDDFVLRASFVGQFSMKVYYTVSYSTVEYTGECDLNVRVLPMGGRGIFYRCVGPPPFHAKMCGISGKEICPEGVFHQREVPPQHCACISNFEGKFCENGATSGKTAFDRNLPNTVKRGSSSSGIVPNTGQRIRKDEKSRRSDESYNDLSEEIRLSSIQMCSTEKWDIMIDTTYRLLIKGLAEDTDYLLYDSEEYEVIDVENDYYEVEWCGAKLESCIAAGTKKWKTSSAESISTSIIKEIACTRSSVFALTFNGDLYVMGSGVEVDGRPKAHLKSFHLTREHVYDIEASYHTLYVLFDETLPLEFCDDEIDDGICSSISIANPFRIESIGTNPYGALCVVASTDFLEHSNGEYFVVSFDFVSEQPVEATHLGEYRINPSEFEGVYPKVVAFEHGAVLSYVLSDGRYYFFCGRDHPSTGEDASRFSLFETNMVPGETGFSVDFIDRLHGGALYIVSNNRIFVSGRILEDSTEMLMGILPSPRNRLPHEISPLQYNGFDERILDLVCGVSCFIITKEGIFMFGRTDGGLGFVSDHVPSHNKITLASRSFSHITSPIEVLGSSGQSSYFKFTAMERSNPFRTTRDDAAYTFLPVLLTEYSGLRNNTLTISISKPIVFMNKMMRLSFVKWNDLSQTWEDRSNIGIGNCMLPFVSEEVRSRWLFWSNLDDDVAMDYFTISMAWDEFNALCGWDYNDPRFSSMADKFDVYSNRLSMVQTYVLGMYNGEQLERAEEISFDLQVLFPKVVLDTTIKIEQNAFGNNWNFFITEKSFDRSSRKGQIHFSVVSKNPNFFVFADVANRRDDDDPNKDFLTNFAHFGLGNAKSYSHTQRLNPPEEPFLTYSFVTEVGGESTPNSRSGLGQLDCDSDSCVQDFVLSFQVTRDFRVCLVPRSIFKVHMIQFCDLDQMSEDYLENDFAVDPHVVGPSDHTECANPSQEVDIDLVVSIQDLCQGELVELVETKSSMGIFLDWEYVYPVAENEVFAIGDWIYVLVEIDCEDVAIASSAFHSISLKDSSGRNLLLYDSVGKNSNYGDEARLIIDALLGNSERLGFHLMLSNAVLRLQPEEKRIFDLEVHLEVLYFGNESPSRSGEGEEDRRSDFNPPSESHRSTKRSFHFDVLQLKVVWSDGAENWGRDVFPAIMLAFVLTVAFVLIGVVGSLIIVFMRNGLLKFGRSKSSDRDK